MPSAPPPTSAPAGPTGEWTWEYEGYDPSQERLRESLCTLGNGYFATRGAAPETVAGACHYPGTYVAGCYNRLVSQVAGRQVENEDLVNLPNWLPLRFRVPSEAGAAARWITPDDAGLLEYRQTLDLRAGTLTRRMRVHLAGPRSLLVVQRRLVHMADPHLAALRTEFTPQGWSGELEVESAVDGDVTNAGVARYGALAGDHLIRMHTGAVDPATVWLRCRTSTSDIRLACAARTRVTAGRAARSRTVLSPTGAAHRVRLAVTDHETSAVEKVVALHTSRDPAISDSSLAAVDDVARAPGHAELLLSHTAAWDRLWRRADLQVPGEAGRILRLHLFHLLQTLSPHTAELDVGVPARGLHGEAYRGHVFWDELFVLPYLNLHFPEISRGLLNYRHRRLGRACRAAEDAGRTGAMYPWQSGSDGREETQTWHLNPRSGRWLPDHTRLQHHVGSAVAYNVWRYCEASGDTEYLHTKGAEMLTQIARFWCDTARYDPGTGRYRILGVVGPDEYHDAYPDAGVPGLNDNAYTNVTAAWVLRRALDLARTLPVPRRRELFDQLHLDAGELDRWEEVSRKLRVPFHAGVVSQFDGYGDLAELDWETYRKRYGDIRRLDRILEEEGDSPNRYQVSKQADVLMLGYLFSPTELADLFRLLGHPMDEAKWRATVEYYLRRTSHGSTLSGLVHGWVLARARRGDAWQHCLEALCGDVADVQGGTTAEGIHLGAMAGTLDLVQRGLAGLETRGEALRFDPAPLPELSAFGYRLRYRGHWDVGVRITADLLRIAVPASEERPVRVVFADRTVMVPPGGTHEFRLSAPPAAGVH
ncbi:glycosyl hydrolase family 65 protein [Streptomyces sp. MST-110588]|uniref:glycoside hydrolase family 65 protein n=1 Tax=Streptomyces sp. MST-110588 TaxID=2833628 RepID=UPI001F5DF4A4|nr:glycosyl hydrolase family 65 protein [Streptomyces sp. MST-110588]UNO44388.1 glycoside hydrolase family 65 protein [Streptomyces sp. MST-110588]